MVGGRAYGVDREYQIRARDILKRMAQPMVLEPYSGDGIDVPIKLGSASRTFDVMLKDAEGHLIVAECKRRKDRIKLQDLNSFAHRVELLRRESGTEVAAVYFAKTAYQLGAVQAAPDSGIRVAVCAQDQPMTIFGLTFERYDPERERRLQDAQVLLNVGVEAKGAVGKVVVHVVDGAREEKP